MTKREVFQLLTMVANFYEQFELDQEKVDTWSKILKSYPFATLEGNLLTHAAESPYPPKISELIRKPAAGARAIPDCNETVEQLLTGTQQASEQVAQENLAKIREILGISGRER